MWFLLPLGFSVYHFNKGIFPWDKFTFLIPFLRGHYNWKIELMWVSTFLRWLPTSSIHEFYCFLRKILPELVTVFIDIMSWVIPPLILIFWRNSYMNTQTKLKFIVLMFIYWIWKGKNENSVYKYTVLLKVYLWLILGEGIHHSSHSW